jgi:hypothetical protein
MLRITTEETLRLFRPPPPSCRTTVLRTKGCKFQARNPSRTTPAPITPASRSSRLALIVDRREGNVAHAPGAEISLRLSS